MALILTKQNLVYIAVRVQKIKKYISTTIKCFILFVGFLLFNYLFLFIAQIPQKQGIIIIILFWLVLSFAERSKQFLNDFGKFQCSYNWYLAVQLKQRREGFHQEKVNLDCNFAAQLEMLTVAVFSVIYLFYLNFPGHCLNCSSD